MSWAARRTPTGSEVLKKLQGFESWGQAEGLSPSRWNVVEQVPVTPFFVQTQDPSQDYCQGLGRKRTQRGNKRVSWYGKENTKYISPRNPPVLSLALTIEAGIKQYRSTEDWLCMQASERVTGNGSPSRPQERFLDLAQERTQGKYAE